MKDILYVGYTVGRTYLRKYRGLFERLEFATQGKNQQYRYKVFTAIVMVKRGPPPVWSR
jgi:hypothetical protein